MNVYARYYDGEAVVSSFDELIDRLKDFGVPENLFEEGLVDDIYDFINSKNIHPKRFRVTQRQYFILIKTNVETLEEFKANAKRKDNDGEAPKKNDRFSVLQEENPGWYDVELNFKRVLYSEQRGRYIYIDTPSRVRLKANSPQDAYNRVVEHLQNRQDIDPRSQYPSIKGRNFSYSFLGKDGSDEPSE